MAVRLRAAPLRRRRRGFPGALGFGLAVLAAVTVPFGMLQVRGRSEPTLGSVRIEALDGAAAEALLPPPIKPFLDRNRIVAYYGNPLAPQMGVVGEYPPEEVIRRLRAQADRYQALSPDRTIVPAVEFIYAVAQETPGREGLYLLRMEDELVQRWVDLTRENGMLLILDLQFGRSNIDRELPHLLPFLKQPNVQLGLDPEFAWEPDEYPLIDIGHIDASVINRTQDLLSQIVIENRLPNKVLIVHQFRPSMITNKALIQPSERVETVIDADGFGAPALKLDQWNRVIRDDGVQRAGIKLFYKHDARTGGMMSETDVMALSPAPLVIVYQ